MPRKIEYRASEFMNNLSRYKQMMRKLLGNGLATWVHAGRFAYLLCFTQQLYTEADMQSIEHFPLIDTVVVDVGANSANWTTILSRKVGKKGRVYAFEADPYYAEVTHKTVRILGLTNVCFFNFGLSDRSEILPLHIIDDLGQRVSGTGRVVQNNSVSKHQTVNVRLEALDQLAITYPELRKTSLIKCDVEGFELKVFYGAKNIIEEARPIIIAEVGNPSPEGRESGSLFKFFRDMKYKSYITLSKNSIAPSGESGEILDAHRPNRIFLPGEYQIPETILQNDG
jgi:FkbM family methyltransferase